MDARVSTCLGIAERHAQGTISAQIALMEMLIASEELGPIEQALAHLARAEGAGPHQELLRVFADNRAGCDTIARQLRGESAATSWPSSSASIAYYRALFDGMVSQSEETSVALYSLGNPQILAAATDEIVALLQRTHVIAPHTRVLDVGCGIGRMEVALAPHVAHIQGIDISPRMIAAARRRCAGLANVRLATCSGHDFADVASAEKELVLAVDSFPYVVQAGAALVDAIFAEAARVLATMGHFVLLNFSYREEQARDRADAIELAARHGFVVELLGVQPFSLWNGTVYSLRRV